MWRTGCVQDFSHADVVLVLGATVNEDGSLSDRLKARLDHSIECYKKDSWNFIVVSGGIGKEGFDETVKMKAYLLSYGVPDSIIIRDSCGVNTYKSSLYIKNHFKNSSIKIVSQFFNTLFL